MKKLKLTKSKTYDSKQPKIVNFFNKNSQPSANANVNQTKKSGFNGDKLEKAETEKSNLKSRSPVENACSKCLRESNKSQLSSCNNCNVILSTSCKDSTVGPVVKGKSTLKKPDKENCLLLNSIKGSPDIIPPTPPIISKRKKTDLSEDNPAKRKFIFSESKCPEETVRSLEPESTDSSSISKNGPVNNYQHKTAVSVDRNVVCGTLSDVKNELNCGIAGVKVDESDCQQHIQPVNKSEPAQRTTDTSVVNQNIKVDSDINDGDFEVLKQNVKGCPTKTNCKQTDTITSDMTALNTSKAVERVLHPLISHVPGQVASTCQKIVNADNQSDQDDEFGDCSFLDNLSFDDAGFKDVVNLENGIRCEVTSVEYIESCREVVLGLKPCATCVLRGSWVDVVVKVGDTVNITARQLPDQAGCWVVDNDGGLLVVHPDTLVSGTSVVGSLFCMRRSVLGDMYRGMDSDSQVMMIGSFLHQLLQEVLKKNVSSLEDITNMLNTFVSSRDFIFSLYSSGMSLEKAKETLLEFVPKIHTFLQKYIFSGRRKSDGNTWNNNESWSGVITDVADIEENIWASRLGLKGKVDVTVKTSAGGKHKVMPLELKTGRASFSAEHRGQVILYTMMMMELGRDVNSGLLLYLREGVMKEVQVGPVERRDLVLLRNQLVTQLQASREVSVCGGRVSAPPLPPPIHHHACAKCPYLTLCSAALKKSESSINELSDGHPLRLLSITSTEHITVDHMTYVFHWSGLLRLEHTDTQLRSPALHDIWTLSPQIRKKRGSCVSDLRLVGNVIEVTAGSYEHVFEWEAKEGEIACSLAEGEYVIVSSDCRPAVAAGPIRHIALNQITLYLERDLSRQKTGQLWHLDKYESQSGLVFNMTNLGCLLDNTEQAGRLRRAIINLELPQFKPKLSSRILKVSVDLLAALNDQQCSAIFRAFAAEHYILIKGMPGTGKTATIVALVQLAVRLGLSVLVTSHTHSAVDNVLLRLRDRVDFLRLGASHKVHPELSPYGETGLAFSSPDQLHDFYNSKKVVGVTCLGATHPLLARRQFDLCLVDEATQVLQPTVLRPLFSAHKFILIGDPNQLPPLVRSSQAKELGLGQSLFERLDRPAVTTELSQQYRMNKRLTQLANTLTYNGKLECASDSVAQANLQLPRPLGEVPDWIRRTLSPSLVQSIIFLDTGVSEAKHCANKVEADIVTQLLSVLKKAGMPDEQVGVMAPYRAQVELLRQHCRDIGSCVEVNTVDQYQGRDKEIVLYSCTRSATPTESDILGDKNRLTVAITRARHKLIFIGNVTLLRGYKLFNTVIDFMSDDSIISPYNETCNI